MSMLQPDVIVSGEKRETATFAKNVLDSMLDWVRVINKDGAAVFMNKSMLSFFKDHPDDIDFDDVFLQGSIHNIGIMDFELVISAALNNNEYSREISIGGKVFVGFCRHAKNPYFPLFCQNIPGHIKRKHMGFVKAATFAHKRNLHV